MSNSLWPYGLQHARPPCPSLFTGVWSNSCPLNRWCHPTISTSVIPSPPALNSFPSSGFFPSESALHIRWPKYWNFSFSISPLNEYSVLISFRIEWLDILVVQGTLKSVLQHQTSKASIHWCSAFFMVQLLHPYMTTGKTIALTIWALSPDWCVCFLMCCLGWPLLFFQVSLTGEEKKMNQTELPGFPLMHSLPSLSSGLLT